LCISGRSRCRRTAFKILLRTWPPMLRRDREWERERNNHNNGKADGNC
jgi:hypothetical protein